VISIELDSLSPGPTPGTLAYTMDSRIMRASYNIYVFEEGQLRSMVGSLDGRTVELTVREEQSGSHTYKPSAGAAPMGGFKNKLHYCRILSVVEKSPDKE
jgi:hypothetical protein